MEYILSLGLISGDWVSEIRKSIEHATGVHDSYVEKTGEHTILIATHQKGVQVPLNDEGSQHSSTSLNLFERPGEELIALASMEDTNYSSVIARIFSDPYNTPGLIDNPRISMGFKFDEHPTRRIYDTPEDTYALLKHLKDGGRITRVYRKTGEHAAALNERLLACRLSEYYPSREEFLKPFKATRSRAKSFQTIPISLEDGRITIDNTFNPKRISLRED
ncbi:MAG: fructose 1,6-bisphosphatase [Candidatus Altiarchaeota archaeon]